MKAKLAKKNNLINNKYIKLLVLCTIMLFFIVLFKGQSNANEIINNLNKNDNTQTLSVIGDLDGNGQISITDLIKLKLHLLKVQTLDDKDLISADINNDGAVTITDLVQLNLTTLGIKDYISLRESSSSIEESNENVEYTEDLNQERALVTSSVYNIMKASSDDTGVIQNGEYLIQFEANGGEIDTYFVKANLGDEISVPTPTRTYTLKFNTNGGNAVNNITADGIFLGWYAIINNQNVDVNWSKNSSGNIVMSELDGMNNGQIRVYAKWGEVNINIPSVTVEKIGYIFKGWYTNFNCTNKLDTEYFEITQSKASTTTDVTIYAGWTPKEYNITYDLDGGTLDIANPETYNIETKSFTLNNPTKTGYEFNGWLEEGKTTPVATAKISMGTVGDKKYTATWEKKSYTVKFNTDGGSVNPSSINAVYEEKIILPEPTKNGYDFVNWKLNNSSYQAKEEYTVTDNVTFTSEWKTLEEGIYVSLYDSNNDGIGDSLNFSKLPLTNNNIIENYGNIENSSYSKIDDLPWKKDVEKIITVNIMDKIYPTSTALWFAELKNLIQINNIGNIDTSNVTNMKNMFENCNSLKSINVSSFDTSNVTNMSGMFIYCTNLESLNLSTFNTSNVTDMSNMFLNCDNLTNINLSNLDTKKVQNISAMFEMCTALKEIDLKNFDILNVTNYKEIFSYSGLEKIYGNGTWVKVNNSPNNSFNGAKTDYVIINVEVSFDANGGSVSSNKKTVEYGKKYGELPVATKSGETFDGWFTQVNGGNPVSVDNLVSNAENHTLYAHWSKSSISVIINPAGGYVDITDNTGVTKKITESTKYEQAYNTSLQYGEPQKESVTESKTEYTITYDGNGGIADKATDEITNTKITSYRFLKWKQSAVFNGDISNIMGSGTYKFTQTTDEPDLLTAVYKETVEKNEVSEAVLPGAKRDGYTFTGWYDNSGNIVGGKGTVYQPSEDITLYAHWKINTSTIRIDPNGGTVKIGGTNEIITSAKEYTQDYNTTLTYEVEPKNGEVDNNSSYTITYNTNGGNENIPNQTAKITKAKEYIFSGWTKSDPFNGNITPATKTYTFGILNNAIDTITANYSENSGSSQYVDTIALSSIVPTKSGYQFMGWVSSTDGKTYQPGASFTPTDNTIFTAKWEDKTITVTYDANGDNVLLSENSKEVKYNEKYGVLITPSRTGYSFEGWYTEVDGGDEITAYTTVQTNENHTIYAHWKMNGITVTFDVNGDNATVSMLSKEVVYDEEYGTLPDAQRDGYEFDGWFTSPTGGFKITPDFTVTENKNHTIYAHWIAKKITVTYDGNEGTPRKISKVVTYDKAYGELDIADREGYTFDGWYTQADGGEEITENTIVKTNANHTIYAHWATKKVYVTYEGNGGKSSEINKEVSYRAKYGELATADRTGYKFDGWFTEADGGTEVTSDTYVMNGEDHTIYAHWTKKGITVTFDANGGTVSETSREVTYGKVYGTLPQPTKEGYQFSGWYTSDGNEVRISTKVKTLDDHTLYARWNGVLSTISIDPNGGKITIHSQNGTDTDLTSSKSYSQESNTSLTYENPTKESTTTEDSFLVTFDMNGGNGNIPDENVVTRKITNYTFNGWTKPNPISGTLSEENRTYTFGNVENEINTIIASYAETETIDTDAIVLPSTIPTKDGYDFAGWKSSTDNQIYQSGASFTPKENTILTAQWSADVIVVTYDATGGQVNPTDEQINKTVGKEYGELPTPINRTGYTFDGWYTNATGGDNVTSSTIVTQTTSHTLYAHWKADKSDIIVDPNGGQVTIYSPSDSTGETISNTKKYTQEYDTKLKYDIPTKNDDVESEIYVVMYDTNGGNGTIPDQNVNVAKTIKYTFDKWEKSDSFNGILSEINKTYSFGVPKLNTDKITASYTSSIVYGNAEITLPQAPTKDGYKFGGWKLLTNGQIYLAGASYTLTENTSFVAQWNTNKITVIYDGNGGTASETSTEVTYGGVYGKLATATREGYEFNGWYTQAEGGKEFKANTKVKTEENHTLYAHWNANYSSLIVDTNGAKITIQSQTGTDTDFVGYKVYNQEYNTKVYFRTPVFDSTIETDSYLVTYNMNGGIGSIPDENATITTTTGHVFSGWIKSEPFSGTLSATNTEYTFGSNNGTVDTIIANYADSTSTNVDSITLSSIEPTRTGYKFTGWKSESNNQIYQSGASYTPTEDTTFTAQWELNTITVSYDARGGTVNPTSTHTNKTVDEQYGELPIATFTGYIFDGWYTSAIGGDKVISSTIVTNTQDHTLYAHWNVNKSTLTINPNGGQVTVYSPTGGTADTITNTKDYVQNYNTTLTYNTPTRNDVTDRRSFYAISYNLDGGVGYIPSQNAIITRITTYTFSGWTKSTPFSGTLSETNRTYTFGNENEATSTISANYTDNTSTDVETITLSSITPTKSGYEFAGWKSSLNNQTYNAGASYTPTGNTIFTAQWSAKNNIRYKVQHKKMDLNGDYTIIEEEIFTGATNEQVSPEPHSYTGFKTPDRKTATIAGDESTVIVYEYERNIYTFTLETGNGVSTTGSTQSGTYYYGKEIVLKLTTNNGYTNAKWTSSNTQLVGNPSALNTTFNMPAGAIKMTASAEIATYQISYNLNGGSVAGTNPTSYTINTETFTLINPTRTGFDFQGWTGTGLSSITTNVTVTKGSTGNRTYTAVWEETEVEVTFNPTGGSFSSGTSSTKIIQVGDVYGELPLPTLTGYTFVGWYTQAQNGTLIKSNTTMTETNNHVLYAHWEINESTLVVKPNGGTVTVDGNSISSDQSYKRNYNTTLTLGTPYKTSSVDKTEYYTISYNSDGGSSVSSQNAIVTKTTSYPFREWVKSSPFYGTLSSSGTTYTYGSNLNTTSSIEANYSITVTRSAETITLAYKPTKLGYAFTGWKSSTNNQIYSAGIYYTPTGNTTMTAQWKEAEYTIKFNSNGGTGTMSDITGIKYNEVITLNTNIFTKTGSVFLGWSDSASSSTVLYEDGDSVSNLSLTDGDTVVLYAVWKRATSKLIIDPGNLNVAIDGITINGITEFEGEYNSTLSYKVTSKDTTESDNGYSIAFYGNGGIDENNQELNGDVRYATRDTTITHKFSSWNKTEFNSSYGTMSSTTATGTYTFKGTDGAENKLSINETETSSTGNISITTPTVTKDIDITFVYNYPNATDTVEHISLKMEGWYTSDGTRRTSNGGTYTPTTDEALYASWKNEASNVPERSKYIFNGWYTEDGEYVCIGVDDLPLEPITLYAKWIEKEISTDFSSFGYSGMNVGDIINYNPTLENGDSKEYEVTSELTGDTSTQDKTFSTSDAMEWKILGINEDTGSLLIVSANGTPETLSLYQKSGLFNAKRLMENISNVYGHGYGAADSRSISIYDIENFSSYDETVHIANSVNGADYYIRGGYMETVEIDFKSEFSDYNLYEQIIDSDNNILGFRDKSNSKLNVQTYYDYTATNYFTEDSMNTLIKYNGENRDYWVATYSTNAYMRKRWYKTEKNMDYYEFDRARYDLIRSVSNNKVAGNNFFYTRYTTYGYTTSDGRIWNSGGAANTAYGVYVTTAVAHKVCPIVYLKPNLELEKNGSGEWEILGEIEPDNGTLYAKLYDTNSDSVGDYLTLSSTNKTLNIGTLIKDYGDVNTVQLVPTSNQYWEDNRKWYNERASIETVDVLDTIYPNVMFKWFYECTNLTEIKNIKKIKTNKVTNLAATFSQCTKLEELDLRGFDTSNVTTMLGTFYGCTKLTDLDTSTWNTSNVINLGALYKDCSSLASIDLSNFDTSKNESLSGFFSGCTNLTEIITDNFDVSNVTACAEMFKNCSSLKNIDGLQGFKITNKVTAAFGMFDGCTVLEYIDMSDWDPSNVTGFSYMFRKCRALTTLDLSKFVFTATTVAYYMFNGCSNLTTIYYNPSIWKVTDTSSNERYRIYWFSGVPSSFQFVSKTS